MTVAIIDYGAGNLRSAEKALRARDRRDAAARETRDDHLRSRTSSPRADRVVLPGDGAFADCRRNLDAVPGMIEAIDEVDRRARPAVLRHLRRHAAPRHPRPRARASRRASTASPAKCAPSRPTDPALKVPHMGWNTMRARGAPPAARRHRARRRTAGTPISCTASTSSPSATSDVVAVADYGGPVTAIVARGNVAGTQFHPEKSQKLGLALIANFLKWKP